MAIKHIPDLATAASLSGTDLLPVTQGSNTPVKATLSTTATFVLEQTAANVDITGGTISGITSFTVESTDAGASSGPTVNLDRNSASPAIGDNLGSVEFLGRDSLGNSTQYGRILGVIVDPTDASEDGRLIFQTIVAGSTTTRMRLDAGLVVGSATGGDQGAGTVNATAVYDDGVLLTPYVLEQARNGSVDLVALDTKVPNLYDEEGNLVEELNHTPARRFLARIGTPYDPLDIDKYAQHWKDKTHLSSMVNPATAKNGKDISIGEWVQRLLETVEIQAVHIDKLNQRLKAVEALLP